MCKTKKEKIFFCFKKKKKKIYGLIQYLNEIYSVIKNLHLSFYIKDPVSFNPLTATIVTTFRARSWQIHMIDNIRAQTLGLMADFAV